MSDTLKQMEADALFALEKHATGTSRWSLPDTGGGIVVPLVSADRSESFHLDISRGRIDLARGKFQNRARTTIVLARVDIGGAPHRNPDDEEIACPHLHIYREGYGDRWAYALPADSFKNPLYHWQTLIDFMRYCNVTRPPEFDRGLFT